MEFKDYLVIIVIFAILLGVYHYTFNGKEDNLGLVVWQDKMDFRNGFSINSTDVLTSARALTVASASVSGDLIVTDDATITDDINVGSASANGCIGKYKGGVLYYIDFATSTGNGTFIVTSTKPTGCD